MGFFFRQVEQEKRRALIEQAVQLGLLRRVPKTKTTRPTDQPVPRLRLVWVNPSTSKRATPSTSS